MSRFEPPPGGEDIALPDALLRYWPAFVPGDVAAAWFRALRAALAWGREDIVLFGRQVQVPRLVAWYGDPGAGYRYSGVCHRPRPWLPELAAIRDRVAAAAGCSFNAVLANLYRDGGDSMGWHSDDEPELGPRPVIASLSLGAARRFRLRHRRTGETFALELAPGSLLVMAGETQRCWQHALPKTARAVGERINLTFRRVRRDTGA